MRISAAADQTAVPVVTIEICVQDAMRRAAGSFMHRRERSAQSIIAARSGMDFRLAESVRAFRARSFWGRGIRICQRKNLGRQWKNA